MSGTIGTLHTVAEYRRAFSRGDIRDAVIEGGYSSEAVKSYGPGEKATGSTSAFGPGPVNRQHAAGEYRERSTTRDITRAPLIAGVLGLILGLAVLVCGCAPRSPAPMIPSEGAVLPRWCAQAIRGNAELVVLCADSWQTCEEARLSAVRWGWWRKVHAVTPNCFRSDRKVLEAHEQRGVIR